MVGITKKISIKRVNGKFGILYKDSKFYGVSIVALYGHSIVSTTDTS